MSSALRVVVSVPGPSLDVMCVFVITICIIYLYIIEKKIGISVGTSIKLFSIETNDRECVCVCKKINYTVYNTPNPEESYKNNLK